MNCPNCGRENNVDERFCEDCGAQLVDIADVQKNTVTVKSQVEVGQELLNRFYIKAFQPWGKGFRYYATDKTKNDLEVFVYERPSAKERPDEPNPLKLQWDMLKEIKDTHLPSILDYIEEGENVFLVTEFYTGESLDEIMKRDKIPFSAERVAQWGIDLCGTLSQLHDKKLLHRDLQPSNFYIRGDDSILITGFDRLCMSDLIPEERAVTPGFSAPESYGIGDGKIDFRSDIYSVGASLYNLISGKTPLLEQRENFFVFPPFRELKIKVEPAIEKVIMKSVNKKIEDRFETINEFGEALSASLNAEKPAVPAVPVDQACSSDTALRVGIKTDIGCVRSINQDSCLYLDFVAYEKSEARECSLFIVADGMGGEAEGEKASSLAIRAISKHVLDSYLPTDIYQKTQKLVPEDVAERGMTILSDALKEANKLVFEYSQQDISRKGMGSTISAAIIDGSTLVVGHAGDTRVYLINEAITQISEDHSLVGRLVKMGQLKKEEALKSPQRSLVYRALGTNPELEVDTYFRDLKAGDAVLLCSDGCWEYYTDDELFTFFREKDEPQDICDNLVSTCLERGADDNCTAIVVKVGGTAG